MDKHYKPVPDVECLKYHGTPEKPDIKIFVSHRIDLDSETIDNPLYIPVRCGAVYDDREGVTMLGDDTGENISEKRESYCELTVQYWAWKNVKADYYGLCQYRRYLSFSDTLFNTKNSINQHVECETLDETAKSQFKLNDPETVSRIICNNDGVTIKPIDISKVPSPYGTFKTLQEHWVGWRDLLIKETTLNLLDDIIQTKYPAMYPTYREYMDGGLHYGYSCFVLSKGHFSNLCEFEFEVLFELEKRIDTTYYSETMTRTFGYMGEILSGTYLYYLTKRKNLSLESRQLVFFKETTKIREMPSPVFPMNNIPIALVMSDFYVPYASVFLKSLVTYVSKSNNYDIIVLEKNISERNKESLCRIANGYSNVSIRFFNAKKVFGNKELYIASPAYAEEAYYRLLTPWILEKYEKAIVMDCDIIMKHDIAELFLYDVSEYLAGGVVDVVYQGMLNLNRNGDFKYCSEDLKMNNPYAYLNTGVLLMNLKKMRECYTLSEIIDFSSRSKFRIQEQDILNYILKEKVLFLPIRWNCYVRGNDWVKEQIDNAPVASKRQYFEESKKAFLLHFASLPKPWDDPTILNASEFWKIARETDFYEVLIGRIADGRKDSLVPKANSINTSNCSGARKLADKLLPRGTRRREVAKKLLPKGSLRWYFCKQIYYIFAPQYRPKKGK